MKIRIFFVFFIPFLSGCEIVASVYVEKDWVTGHPYEVSRPDLKTKASIDFKIPVGKDAKKHIDKSK